MSYVMRIVSQNDAPACNLEETTFDGALSLSAAVEEAVTQLEPYEVLHIRVERGPKSPFTVVSNGVYDVAEGTYYQGGRL